MEATMREKVGGRGGKEGSEGENKGERTRREVEGGV